jgi:hypothetical protein
MQAVRWLFAVTVLVLCARGAAAQARPQGAARSMRDTLPEIVVQRTIDAWTRKDLDATFANFDSVFTHEMLGDPAGAQRLRRDDYVRQMKGDTAVMRTFKTERIRVLHTDVYGAFVNQVGRAGERSVDPALTATQSATHCYRSPASKCSSIQMSEVKSNAAQTNALR